MKVVIVVFVVLSAVVVITIRAAARDRRQRALVRLCLDAGVSFAVVDPFVDTLFLPFRLFGRGSERGIDTVVWDPRDDGNVRVFDYWYLEQSSDGLGSRVRVTCGVVPLPFGVPRVAVVPRGMADPSRERIEGQRVRLELDTFNERFDVWSLDPRAAVALFDQRMVQAILALPLRVAIYAHEDHLLCVASPLEPAEMLVLLEAVRTLANRVPTVVASLYPPRPAEGPFEDRWLQGRWSPTPTSAEHTEPS
jgi:hypothetical protein